MNENTKRPRLPTLVVGNEDHQRLTDLAIAALDRLPEVAEELLREMDRARVVNAGKVPESVIRMGFRVVFESNDGRKREVTLVFPGEADIAEGKVSVMTPIGTALIGLSKGQSISWTARDGRRHELTVLHVDQSAAHAET